jgi:sugar/nucleoside kinase (ribokinase family)
LRELISHFDIVRASVEDCMHLLGADRVANEQAEEEVIRFFIKCGATVGLMTLGERGCIVGTRDKVVRVPAQRGQVVDTTGAGDSFSTAFLIGYMQTQDFEWSARFGAAAVIYMIERTGGVHVSRMPTRAEVNRRLAA